MRSLHRLRIEVPAQAGVLGRVGRSIARLGGDIVTIDLQDIDDSRAVDDVVVSFPPDITFERVAQALEDDDAGRLRFWAPVEAAVDPVVRSIRWACSIISADAEESEEELLRVVAEICGREDVWVFDVDANADMPLVSLAGRKSAPVVVRVDQMPQRLPVSFSGPGYIAAVPDGRLTPRRVAILARPDGQTFSATEIERVGAILVVHRHVVDRLRAGGPSLPGGPWLDVSSA